MVQKHDTLTYKYFPTRALFSWKIHLGVGPAMVPHVGGGKGSVWGSMSVSAFPPSRSLCDFPFLPFFFNCKFVFLIWEHENIEENGKGKRRIIWFVATECPADGVLD